jgi:SAM-dependent methyltransferase
MGIEEIDLNIDKTTWELEQDCPGFKSFNEFYESYPKSMLDFNDFTSSCSLDDHLSALEVLKRENRAGKLLYVACAFGFGIKTIQSLGFEIKGVDVEKRYVSECVNRGLDVEVGTAFDLQFPDCTFDVVISKDFLRRDYLFSQGIRNGLFEQLRVVKKGGIAVNYSMLSNADFGFGDRLKQYEFENLPFSALRRYSVNFSNQTRYVDVFEK